MQRTFTLRGCYVLLQSFEAAYVKMQAIDSQWKRDAAQEKRWKQAELRAVQQRKDAEKQAAEKEAERIAKEKAGTGLAAQAQSIEPHCLTHCAS